IKEADLGKSAPSERSLSFCLDNRHREAEFPVETMAWFCGEKDRDCRIVPCKYMRRPRCYSPFPDERSRGWYYADDPRSPFFSPLAETIVCFNAKDLEENSKEDKCPCVKKKEEDDKKCLCVKKKEEDDKKCLCVKKKEEDDKKCPCVKKKEEDDKKCPCVKKKEQAAGKAPEIVCAPSCKGDGSERFTVEVYDRTDGPTYRQYGSCYSLSLSPRTSVDDILRVLAPDPYRQKVVVHWIDDNFEELDYRIPLSEIRRFAKRFYCLGFCFVRPSLLFSHKRDISNRVQVFHIMTLPSYRLELKTLHVDSPGCGSTTAYSIHSHHHHHPPPAAHDNSPPALWTLARLSFSFPHDTLSRSESHVCDKNDVFSSSSSSSSSSSPTSSPRPSADWGKGGREIEGGSISEQGLPRICLSSSSSQNGMAFEDCCRMVFPVSEGGGGNVFKGFNIVHFSNDCSVGGCGLCGQRCR
ncbi:hypothetical protein L249_3159, partial [Ophiocordyceps polyrhachis-furcata BCC 54312]